MHGHGKSDDPVVPAKPPNELGRSGVEVVEGRGSVGGERGQRNTSRTRCRVGRVNGSGSRACCGAR